MPISRVFDIMQNNARAIGNTVHGTEKWDGGGRDLEEYVWLK